MTVAKRKILALTLCLCVLLGCCPAFAADGAVSPAPEAEAEGDAAPSADDALIALLYEQSTDTWLFEQNTDRKNAPASMTKVMTAVLVLEKDPHLTGVLTVAPEAVDAANCSWMDTDRLYAGEVISVWDAMNYLLIASGNEAATALAIYFSGSVKNFVEEMNDKAAALGMNDTRYYDPHGLMSGLQETTARDMLKLCRYAMTFENFRRIVSSTEGTVPASNMRNTGFTYKTTNRVMDPRGCAPYETGFEADIIGVKTGSTSAAGYNLSCCMVHGDLTFYSVVMQGRSSIRIGTYECVGSFLDTAQLLRYARLFEKVGFAAGEPVGDTFVPGAMAKLSYAAKNDVYILNRTGTQPVTEIALNPLEGFIAAGDAVGTLTLRDEFGNARAVELIAAADLSIRPWLPYALGAGALVLAAALATTAALVRRAKKRGAAKPKTPAQAV